MHRAGTGCRFSPAPLLLFGRQSALRPSLLVPGRYASRWCSLNIRQRWFLSAHSDGLPVMLDPGLHQVDSTVARRPRGRYTPSTSLRVVVRPVLFPGVQLAQQAAPPRGAFHTIIKNRPFCTYRGWLKKCLLRLGRAQWPPLYSGWLPRCHQRNDKPEIVRMRLLLVLIDSVLTSEQEPPGRKPGWNAPHRDSSL